MAKFISYWLSFLISLFFIIAYLKGGGAIVNGAKDSVKSTGSRFFILHSVIMSFAGFIIIFTELFFCIGILHAYPWVDNLFLIFTGTVLTYTGILSSFYIRYKVLKNCWSCNIELQEQHPIIENGIYHKIRHPLYATTSLTYTGAALTFAAWWNYIACMVMILGYISLTQYEDKFLANNLPGYNDYRQRTRYRWIPGVW